MGTMPNGRMLKLLSGLGAGSLLLLLPE